jgi:hypothetical protein
VNPSHPQDQTDVHPTLELGPECVSTCVPEPDRGKVVGSANLRGVD